MLELLFWENRGVLQDALVISIALAAFLWGGGPERAVIAVWLITFELASKVMYFSFGPQHLLLGMDPISTSQDVLAGLLWIGIALYANRIYTLWIAAFQIWAIMAHVARGIVEGISPIGYATMFILPGWFELIIMAIGLSCHIRRKRKYGPYRDWRIVRKPGNLDQSKSATESIRSLSKGLSKTWRDDLK